MQLGGKVLTWHVQGLGSHPQHRKGRPQAMVPEVLDIFRKEKQI